jgi:hypothetical protein
MPSSWAVPASILVGAAMIAAAVYFGLRDRSPTSEGAPSPSPVVDAQAAATAALEAQRATFVEQCWKPAAAERPAPDHSSYLFDLAFDERGVEVGRGISEVTRESRADVARCLRALPGSITIPPPGARRSARVTITLP